MSKIKQHNAIFSGIIHFFANDKLVSILSNLLCLPYFLLKDKLYNLMLATLLDYFSNFKNFFFDLEEITKVLKA